MAHFDSYWANKAACDDAERAYYEKLSGCKSVFGEAEEDEEVEAPKKAAAATLEQPKVASSMSSVGSPVSSPSSVSILARAPQPTPA